MTGAFVCLGIAGLVTELAHRRVAAGHPVSPIATDLATRFLISGIVLFILARWS